MEKSILIADQPGGLAVSVRDAREPDENTEAARVIQLVSQVARPSSEVLSARDDYVLTADSTANLDGQYPAVEGDVGGYLTSFKVWGPGLNSHDVPDGLWWGVVYDGSLTTVKIYPDDPSEGGVTPVCSGSVWGRGGFMYLNPVDDSNILAEVNVAATVETDDEDAANALIFPGWFLYRQALGDCGGRIGICLLVNDFTSFVSADITPLVLSDSGSLLARLETKQYLRGSVDFTRRGGDILMLPVQWWEVQGIASLAVHITAIEGGGGVYPQIIRG